MHLTLTVSFYTYGGIYLDLLFGEELTGIVGPRARRPGVGMSSRKGMVMHICFENLTLIGHGFPFCEEKV